jgi:hypothetical protein
MSGRSAFTEIYPIQPFFVRCTNQYYKKTLANSPVAHFYSFTADHGERLISAVPDKRVRPLYHFRILE